MQLYLGIFELKLILDFPTEINFSIGISLGLHTFNTV